MAEDGGELDLVMRRGVEYDHVFIYRPRDKTLPPFSITGQSVEMRIQPQGAAEIVYTDVNPGIRVSDGANGEITLNPTGAMKTAYAFQNAPYVIKLNGKLFLQGTITVKNLYER